VAEFLYDLMTRYGVAEIVMSDQGREFVNEVNQKLFKLCGTDHRISSAYHPQTNGLDERMNQTLKGALVKFFNANHDDWDVHIKSVLFAYRTSRNDSTKFTPFELMFGRTPILPIEMDIASRPDRDDDDDVSPSPQSSAVQFNEKVSIMMAIREQVKAKAMSNIEKAQERQKKHYDAKHKPPCFKEGDVVLLRNKRNEQRKGGKLEQPWSGPYTVSRLLSKGVCKLQNNDGVELKTSYNSSRLKIYHQSKKSVPECKGKQPLIEKDKRLDDNIINEAQKILRKQFPMVEGWQDTLLAQTSFSTAVEESIQIHFTGQNHWVCSTSIGGYIRVYDSAGSTQLTSSMEVQLTDCYKSLISANKLEVELPPVQVQSGAVDCGLFAIAFAYDLAAGNDPSNVHYDQCKMREHLTKCLESESFAPFPRQPKSKAVRFRKEFEHCEIELFCHCFMPESWDDMIECDLCGKWFHVKCENLSEFPDEEDEWLCSACRPPSPKRSKH
jgi:hypothetical protein